jgi:hypothetical protein
MTGAAAFEENAELQDLRDRADQTGREAAQTLAELAGRVADARDPKVVARRLTARARHTAAIARRRVPGNLAGPRGAKGAALAAIPVLGLLTLAAVARYRGWPPLGTRRGLSRLPLISCPAALSKSSHRWRQAGQRARHERLQPSERQHP